VAEDERREEGDQIYKELGGSFKQRITTIVGYETREGKQYDLDFWVTEKDGRLSITETTIHKRGRPTALSVD